MMQRPSHVPEFGKWDANDHVPFTVVFENARDGKGGGKMINPNDPSENPAAFGLLSEEASQPPFQSEEGSPFARVPRKSSQQQHPEEAGPMPRSRQERRNSREENNYNPPSQEHHAGLSARRISGDAQGYHRPGLNGGQARPASADGVRRGSSGGGVRENWGPEPGAGENKGVDQSSNYPTAYQGRLGNRPGSPYDRKVPPEGGAVFAPGTPVKSRLRPGSTRGNETPDRGATPPFGAWNEKDPSSGDGFTKIFNTLRDEKQAGGPVHIPLQHTQSPAGMNYNDAYTQQKNRPQKKCPGWACCSQPSVDD